MRRRRITRKPTKGESIFGGIVCFAMGCFGLFALPSGFDPVFAGFKAIWCLLAFGMGVYNFLIAAGKVKMGGYEIMRVNAEERFLTRLKDVSDPDYSAFLAAQLERFLDENGVERGKLLGVGVSLAGVISAESRSILFAPTLALRDVPFSQLLQAIPYPTRLENDGTCGGFAEWFSSPGTRNIAFLSIEDGVGGSVLVNGAQFPPNAMTTTSLSSAAFTASANPSSDVLIMSQPSA